VGAAIVQISAKGLFSNATTATCTLTGVTSGNTIAAFVNHYNSAGSGSGTTVSDGTSYTNDIRIPGHGGASGFSSLEVFQLLSAAAGTHTIVSTAAVAVNGFGQMVCMELSGLSSSPFDQSASSSNNSTTPSVGPTGTLAVSSELCFAVYCNPGVATTGITNPPTPASTWVSQYADSSTADLPLYIASLISPSTAALSASWGTLSTSGQWIAAIVTFQPAAAPTTGNPRLPRRRSYFDTFIPR
jgi:hypothetical protein